MTSRDGGRALATVRAAASGVGAQVAWQVWSRVLAFAIKAVAVRAVGPKHFAFAEIRLGLLNAAALPVAVGVRSVALRVSEDRVASALVFCSACVTAVLAAVLCGAAAWADPAHAGPICLVAVSAFFNGVHERGRIFATRRERYAELARARAVARIVGGCCTSVSVLFLPTDVLGLYAVPIGNAVHSIVMTIGCELAAGSQKIPWISPWHLPRVLTRDHVKMSAIASWQTLFKSVLENGESLILDVTCFDPEKGAYKLAANIASMLARFFSEALEEQSFNVFSRLAPAFRSLPSAAAVGTETKGEKFSSSDGTEALSPGAESCDVKKRTSRDDEVVSGDVDNAVEAAKHQRAECIAFLHMALKSALLISLLIAVIGPKFSYAFLRMLYGAQWADKTPAPHLLNLYFVYLVFMAANGITEALVSATASTAKLQEQSLFSIALSGVYMLSLYVAGSRYATPGIIAVNCSNMAIRTLYSSVYYTQLTGLSVSTLVLGSMPNLAVVGVLALARALCTFSERLFFAAAPQDTRALLEMTARHAVSGAVSVAMFCVGVFVFEQRLRSYLAVLAKGSRFSRLAAKLRLGPLKED